MKRTLLSFCFLCCATAVAVAGGKSKFDITAVPMSDGKPVYEKTINFTSQKTKAEHLADARIFLAEYFHKSTPVVVVEDKETGRFTVKVELQYMFKGPYEHIISRSTCLADLQLSESGCKLRIYDINLQHKKTESTLRPTAAGLVPESHVVWQDVDEAKLYEQAAQNKKNALDEVEAVHNEVLKLADAYAKKLAGS